MFLIDKTDEFDKWLSRLKDRKAKAKILIRIQRIEESGNFGDCKTVGEGLSELLIHHGPGYRIYLKEHNGNYILLLHGGDKSTQSKDINKAKSLWSEYLNRQD